MKVCPFCREEIRDDALKCRYCSSSLLPLQPAPETAPGPNQVVYILDKDLIRFGKFAVAVLGLVVAVGIILYGIDIKQAAKDAQQAVKDVQQSYKEVQQSVKDAQQSAKDADSSAKSTHQLQSEALLAQKEILKAKEDVEKTEKTASESQKKAKELLDQATTYVASIATYEAKAHSFFDVTVASVGTVPTEWRSSFSVSQLARLYDFPSEFDGQGQTIGLIELAGGYADADLDAYFNKLHVPKPKIASVPVDGASNSPGSESDYQVTLDIEVVGAVAPRAQIVVYFAPNTDQGFADAIRAAVADQINHVSVLNISWGGPESKYPPAALNMLDQALKAGADRQITIVAAGGDGGVTDGVKDGKPHVDFPASSPWVLAIGGTEVIASEDVITSETVWNPTGGGVSNFFGLPEWQSGVSVPRRMDGTMGRGIPDLAAHAGAQNGYEVYVLGKIVVSGGTAASTPLWAGLIALINQGVGRNVGFINPLIYTKIGPLGALRNITEGNNSIDNVKGYSAGPGWNAVTGWGSPDGRKLLKALQAELAATH
jgi:subtilase family serine protease